MGLEIINQLKKKKGFTTDDLSRISGVPLGTLNKILSGITTDPKLETVKAIAKALNCTLDDFDDEAPSESKKDDIFTPTEKDHIKKYCKLDAHGKKIVDLVTAEELKNLEESKEILDLPNNIKDINAHKEAKEREKQKKKRFKLYDLPVSAGTGVYLDSSDYDMITVPLDDISDHADFAVRVSGDSMEDQYYDDDVLLVRIQPEVEYGELGIFIIDGEGYFKQFGKDRLISLNKDYKDIVFNPGMEVSCKGRVLGKL